MYIDLHTRGRVRSCAHQRTHHTQMGLFASDSIFGTPDLRGVQHRPKVAPTRPNVFALQDMEEQIAVLALQALTNPIQVPLPSLPPL